MKKPLVKLPLLLCAFASASLFAADAPKATASKNLLRPTADVSAWQFEEADDAKGSIKSEGDALALTATKVDVTDWHVQAFQAGLELKEGKDYVVTLKARASTKRSAQLYVGANEEDFHPVGLDEVISLTPEWRELAFTFKAENVAAKSNNRLGFLAGQETGTIFVKDLALALK